LKFEAVVLESGCDIGISSTILPNVIIGGLSQVGAGAVVTKDVGYRHVVVGNPAKFVRKL
jgi:acetyltransferase-like isoleucine patch superfamily enzyme